MNVNNNQSTIPQPAPKKDQVIDMRAGAILLQSSKKQRMFGLHPKFLIVLILMIKVVILSLWSLREYHYFDLRCAMSGLNFTSDEKSIHKRSLDFLLASPIVAEHESAIEHFIDEHIREKRSFDSEQLDPRMRTRKRGGKKERGGGRKNTEPRRPVPTTLVTLTNTHLVPVDTSHDMEDIIRMKTIRNRVQPVATPDEDDYEDERTIEINMYDSQEAEVPTKIHVSKIISRRDEGKETDETTAVSVTKKGGKRKGLGRKKEKERLRLLAMTSSTTPTTTTQHTTTTTRPKKKKGMGRKKNRSTLPPQQFTTDTKSPRHLFSPSPRTTTIRPHQSSFLHGAVDPKDSKFSNKGEIRGYKMHPASRRPNRPPKKLNLSNETMIMWSMDEHNYTTLAAPEVTSAERREKEQREQEDSLPFTDATPPLERITIPHLASGMADSPAGPAHSGPAPTLSPEQEEEKRVEEWKESLDTGRGRPTGIVPTVFSNDLPEEKEEEEELWDPNRPVDTSYDSIPPRYILPTEPAYSPTTESAKAKPVLHGFDRSRDSKLTSDQRRDIDDDFQSQLDSFTSSAVCIARALVDIWAFCQVVTALPCLLGVCCESRAFFIPHFVLDILLLVIAFVYSITMVVFSIVLYILVGEMRKQTLFEWLMFALLLDFLLLSYTLVVVISLRCCERFLDRSHISHRKSIDEAIVDV